MHFPPEIILTISTNLEPKITLQKLIFLNKDWFTSILKSNFLWKFYHFLFFGLQFMDCQTSLFDLINTRNFLHSSLQNSLQYSLQQDLQNSLQNNNLQENNNLENYCDWYFKFKDLFLKLNKSPILIGDLIYFYNFGKLTKGFYLLQNSLQKNLNNLPLQENTQNFIQQTQQQSKTFYLTDFCNEFIQNGLYGCHLYHPCQSFLNQKIFYEIDLYLIVNVLKAQNLLLYNNKDFNKIDENVKNKYLNEIITKVSGIFISEEFIEFKNDFLQKMEWKIPITQMSHFNNLNNLNNNKPFINCINIQHYSKLDYLIISINLGFKIIKRLTGELIWENKEGPNYELFVFTNMVDQNVENKVDQSNNNGLIISCDLNLQNVYCWNIESKKLQFKLNLKKNCKNFIQLIYEPMSPVQIFSNQLLLIYEKHQNASHHNVNNVEEDNEEEVIIVSELFYWKDGRSLFSLENDRIRNCLILYFKEINQLFKENYKEFYEVDRYNYCKELNGKDFKELNFKENFNKKEIDSIIEMKIVFHSLKKISLLHIVNYYCKKVNDENSLQWKFLKRDVYKLWEIKFTIENRLKYFSTDDIYFIRLPLNGITLQSRNKLLQQQETYSPICENQMSVNQNLIINNKIIDSDIIVIYIYNSREKFIDVCRINGQNGEYLWKTSVCVFESDYNNFINNYNNRNVNHQRYKIYSEIRDKNLLIISQFPGQYKITILNIENGLPF